MVKIDDYNNWYKKIEYIASVQPKEKLFGKVEEECNEFKEASNKQHQIEELGDLLNVTAMSLIKLNGCIDYKIILDKLLMRDKKYGTGDLK